MASSVDNSNGKTSGSRAHDEGRLQGLTPEQLEFVSDLVAAGRTAIQKKAQIEALSDVKMNPAKLVLDCTDDPVLFCWNSYTLRPHLKREHNLEELRPVVKYRLEQEAEQDDIALEAAYNISKVKKIDNKRQ